MNTEDFQIGLGNNDNTIRKIAKTDFVSFWDERAKLLKWFKPWEKTLDWNPPFARWFVGGQINASYNTLDVNQEEKSSKTAIFWEGEDGSSRIFTYGELYTQVKKFANVLKSLGVKTGDRITISDVYFAMPAQIAISLVNAAYAAEE